MGFARHDFDAPAALSPAPASPPQDAGRARRGLANHRLGLAAEEAAARAYRRAGAAVLARRRRRPEGEIDLILRDGDVLVFAEVKRRRGPVDRDPVGETQWRRLEAAAQRYMVEAQTGDLPCRFDLVLVDATGAVEVIDNARC
ncbi:MAG: YraN family protein [Pseudomonadota bacterium]